MKSFSALAGGTQRPSLLIGGRGEGARNCRAGPDWSRRELGRRPQAGAPGNAQHALAVEHDLAIDRALATKPHPAALFDEPDHLDADGDDVADLDRAAEIQGLGNIDRAGPRQARADDRRNQAGGVEAVNDSAAEAGFAGEMLGEMDRIAIAGQFGEADNVFVADGFEIRLPHADDEVFETIG